MAEASQSESIKVVVVEDDADFRRELAGQLTQSRNIEVVATYDGGAAAIAGIGAHGADVVLLDLGLPDRSGIEVIRAVRAISGAPEFLVLTVFDDDEHLFPALQAGATGYIVKDLASGKDLLQAIEEVMKGGAPMSLGIARRVLSTFRAAATRHARCALLSQRECELLEYLARGYGARKIADILHISYATVRSHQKNIYRKLHVNSLLEAVTLFRGPA